MMANISEPRPRFAVEKRWRRVGVDVAGVAESTCEDLVRCYSEGYGLEDLG